MNDVTVTLELSAALVERARLVGIGLSELRPKIEADIMEAIEQREAAAVIERIAARFRQLPDPAHVTAAEIATIRAAITTDTRPELQAEVFRQIDQMMARSRSAPDMTEVEIAAEIDAARDEIT